MFNTDFCFSQGKLTFVLDGQAGSSGKGKLGSFICEHADNWQFACNTFFSNAGHWVKLDDNSEFLYQTFNSCAYQYDKYEKLYIGPGACIELPAFWREIEENNIPRHKIGISPLTSILQDIDQGYERGTHDFDGVPYDEYDADAWCLIPSSCKQSDGSLKGGPLAKTGTTAHGCGANRARRVLRRPEAKYARDILELKEFICDVPTEIMERLNRGQAGLQEIAQGFQLSYMLPQFYPNCTSRNCTVATSLDDMMIPTYYAGNVIINFATFPIRINSNKYIERGTGKHLTWDEVKAYDNICSKQNIHNLGEIDGEFYDIIKGNSGSGYQDQVETTWDEVTRQSGSNKQIISMTSVTKLPRRVFTWSKHNLEQAICHNKTNYNTYLSINFINYVDTLMSGRRGNISDISDKLLTDKARQWFYTNLGTRINDVRFIGTEAKTDDYILCH